MSHQRKTVSALDIGFGALSFLPDLPNVVKQLFDMALLTKSSRKSLGLVFEQTAAQYADRPFIRTAHATLTYQQANERANQIARALIALNVRAGEAVALMGENSEELLLAVLGIVKLGAVAALINNNQQGKVLAHSVGLVTPKVMLIGASCVGAVESLVQAGEPAMTGVQMMALEKSSDKVWLSDFSSLLTCQSKDNLGVTQQLLASSPAFYIFTSGTTGLPKASIMSHYRWLQAMCGMSSVVRLQPDDVFYCCLPLYHNNALTVSLGVVLAAGACFALDVKFSASRFWDRIRSFEATAFCYIGELLRYLMNQPVSMNDCNHAVRLIVGNGLRPEIWAAFESRFGIHDIYEFYGASESNLGFMNAFGLRETVGFSPIPYEIIECDPDTEMPVRDARGFAKKVGRGQVGLLVSKVTERRPFDGYTDTAANEKKLLRNLFRRGDCWFNSGDLVRRQGWQHIQFVDRLGDTFRWKGENVATSEVEGILSQVEWIEHGAVYGVQVRGADGRAGMAAITLKAGCQFDGEGLAAYLFENLPRYAVPLFVRITGDAQTTGTFKYQKVQLKAEGYDAKKVSDPLFKLDDKADPPTYVALN